MCRLQHEQEYGEHDVMLVQPAFAADSFERQRRRDPAAGCAGTSKARSLLEWRSFYADVVPVDPIIN